MPRFLSRALVLPLVVGGVACSDAKEVSVTATPSSPSMVLYRAIEDGQPTYYEYDTQISGTGGLPGWENPNEAHARDLKEIHRWSPHDGDWHVENRYASPEAHFENHTQSPDVDVAVGYKGTGSFNATARSGAALVDPGYVPAMNLLPDGSSAAMSQASLAATTLANPERAPFAGTQSSAPAVSGSAAAAASHAAEARSARADRLVVTARGRDRELARLRAQFGEGARVAQGALEFSKRNGGEEVRVQFNPAIGAVTRMTALSNGRKLFETVRHYRRSGDVWMLGSIETQNYGTDGRPAGKFSQNIQNIQVR